MISRLEYKKTIGILAIGFIIILISIYYKETIINKRIPKKANYVLNMIDRRK